MFLVGLCGKAGVGKDTAGAVLVDHLGFERFSFADPIKAALSAMFYWPLEKWEDREWKERNLPGRQYSPRLLAQTLGTEWGRDQISSNFWIDVVESRLNELHRFSPSRVVITDVRFENEAHWIQQRGGLVIEIVRTDAPAIASHVSEAGIRSSLIDFTLVNHGAQEDFEAQIYSEIHAKLIAGHSL
jgi:hypothetical protein